ncbi:MULTISPECIES: glycerophosphodiester phosphodiesterase [unclassified Peribacillus]|uniref:glycerophosphodiester phosphodiesterase n=1 Tax=unclassified Peribacillus TaxID=2675266 RepID=UPI00367074DB
MAEWWENLNLFKPGSDDNMGVEDSLNGNFQKIDEKVGDALKDKNGKQYTSIGKRMDEELAILEQNKKDTQIALTREFNVVRDDLQHHSIALRGYRRGAPENTYPAFRQAKQMGFWGIKTDLRLTSDKQWVVFTDATVDRTTNGTGEVASKTLAQMKALDAGLKLGGAYHADERVLSLKEFLWFCREHNMAAYMEIRVALTATDTQELLRIIKEYSMLKRAALISTTIPDLQLIRDLDPNIQVGFSTSILNQTNIDYVKPIPNSFIYTVYSQIVPATYILAINAGLQVDGYQAESYDDAQTAIRNGARRVTTSSVPF